MSSPDAVASEETSVWIEPRHHGGTREIALKGGRTARGRSVFNNHHVVHESELEHRVSKMLQARRGVVEVRSQFPRVSYMGADGKKHDHTFDYWALYSNGYRQAVAVKMEAKRKALQEILDRIDEKGSSHFDSIRIFTEKEATWDCFQNASDILWSRQLHDEAQVQLLLRELSTKAPDVQFGQLYSSRAAIADRTVAIWRLIDSGHLVTKQPGRITDLTWLSINL